MTNISELDVILDSKSGPLSFSPTRETPHDYIERLKEFFSSKEQKAAIDLLEKTAIASWGATDLIADSRLRKPQADYRRYGEYFTIFETTGKLKVRLVEMQKEPLNDFKKALNLSRHTLEQKFPREQELKRVLDGGIDRILGTVDKPYNPTDISSSVAQIENALTKYLGFDEKVVSHIRNAARVELGLKPLALFPDTTAKL